MRGVQTACKGIAVICLGEKEMKKRLCAFSLCLLILLTAVGVFPAEVFAADDQQQSIIHRFDYGSLLASGAGTTVSGRDTLHANYTYNNKTYYGDQLTVEKKLRDAMAARKTEYTFRITSTQGNLAGTGYADYISRRDFLMELINGATEEKISVSTKDGDYLRWQCGGMYAQFNRDYKKSAVTYYTVSLYDIEYYASAAQEKQVDAYVQNYLKGINRNTLSDYALVKKIHDAVCNMTVYDMAYESRSDRYDYSAYGCMKLGRCVCQGYALAFYRLCKEVGLPVRFVYSDPQRGCHAWNVVNLGGKFYHIDCTWDDTYTESKVTYNFFLKNGNDIRAYDSYNDEHKLDTDILQDDYFVTNYIDRVDDYNFNPELPNLANVTFSLSSYSYTYDGKVHEPKVTAVFNGKPFSAFTISGRRSGTNAGTYRMTIQGPADGSAVTRSFVIRPRSISSYAYKYSGKSAYTYTGSSIRPALMVNGLKTSDYTVTYKNNTAVGTASVTAAGKGNYTGSITKSFKINPGAVQHFQVSKRGTDAITFSWTKQPGVSGYQLQQKKNGKWKTVKKITGASTVSYKIKSLSAASTYSFRIRAYKGSENGKFRTYTTCTKPKKTSLRSVQPSKKSATVKWKKVSGSGYQLQYSTSSSFKNAKSVQLSSSGKTSKKITGLKKGKKYYVRVRAVKTRKDSSGKTYKYYSSWSSKKSFVSK